MNAITELALIDQKATGLYKKFNVTRTDGTSEPGGKHENDEYFVLNLTTDKHALPAIAAYAKACANEFPVLANDLRTKLRELRKNEFVTVPETTLPNGTVVPLFKVGKYITGRIDDQLSISESAAPWVKINFFDAKAEAEKAGLKLITELQYLALAHNIASVAANWTSGVVGEGSLYQGLHDDTVEEAQAGDYMPEEESERRWFELSNGERIIDVAGNCYTWIFDDVQGNENGIVSSVFSEDSPSITTAPSPSMENGVGWYPRHGANWSGNALVRGGCWDSRDSAGVFRLCYDYPDRENGSVGFRCTLP